MTPRAKEPGGKILCVRLSGLGDIVHALPALSLLCAERPDWHIVWIVEDAFAGLLEGHPHVDELIAVPRDDWGGGLKNPLRWPMVAPPMLELARRLRGVGFDVSLDFQSSLKSALFVSAACARVRVGFGPPVGRELSHLIQNRLVRPPGCGVHRIERNLALAGALGIAARFEDAVLPVGSQHGRVAEGVVSGLGRPLVIVHPGTSDFAAFKRWPPERYADLASRLVSKRGASVLVTWGPREEQLARRAAEGAGEAVRMAPRLTHLQQLTALLSRADLFIGSDTGPMHMASALNVPAVALFGPKDPVQTGPYRSRSEVVTAPVSCRPCRRRRCADPRCMTGISVEQVFAAACRVIDGGGESRAGPGMVLQALRASGWRGKR